MSRNNKLDVAIYKMTFIAVFATIYIVCCEGWAPPTIVADKFKSLILSKTMRFVYFERTDPYFSTLVIVFGRV